MFYPPTRSYSWCMTMARFILISLRLKSSFNISYTACRMAGRWGHRKPGIFSHILLITSLLQHFSPLLFSKKLLFLPKTKKSVHVSAWVYVHYMGAGVWGGRIPRNWRYWWLWTIQCRCWELNPGPLQEQWVLMTSEQSLHPQKFFFICCNTA